MGPGPLAVADSGAGARPVPRSSPSCAGRPRRCWNGSSRPSPRRHLDRSADLGELVKQLGQGGVESGRVELDLGFGRGIGFYTQMIFELVVADARRADRGLRRRPLRRPGPRAGQRPRRPRRRLCVRAGTPRRGVLHAAASGWRFIESHCRSVIFTARVTTAFPHHNQHTTGFSTDENRTDRPDSPGDPVEGPPLRRDHRAVEDGRLQGQAGQRPAVRSDDRRPRPLPRRVHAAGRHRDPGSRRGGATWV